MHWLPLTLLCAFSLASADAATKKHLCGYTVRELVMVRFAFPAMLLAPLLLIYPLPPLPAAFWGWVGALVPLEVLAMLLYMRAIRDSPLYLTLPYLAFTPVVTAVTGLLLLGEQPSPKGLSGILLVVAGAYLLNSEHAESVKRPGWRAPLQAAWRDTGSRLMVAVAAIYGLTSVMGKAALRYVPPRTFGPFYFVLLGALTVTALAAHRPSSIRVLWRRPRAHLLIGACMAIMVITHFTAIERVEAAYMIAVKRVSLLFGILYGALLFKERRLGRNLLAGALMVAGVALIAL
jgi:drug/metabolite transporter (DMT)-like permease